MPRYCLFDIDGTLIDAAGAGQAAMKRVLADVFDIHEIVGSIPSAGRTDAAITTELLNGHGIAVDRFEDFHLAYTKELPLALKAAKGRVLSGVVDLLRRLDHRENVVLGLLTGNFEQAAWQKLEHFEISHTFDVGAFGDHHCDRDDVARDALRAIRERFGNVDPQSVWVIGDTPSDVACARAINARVAAVATGIFDADALAATNPDLVLESLDEPMELLRHLSE